MTFRWSMPVATVVAAFCLISAGGVQATGSPPLDQQTIDQLMGKADQATTPPAALPAPASGESAPVSPVPATLSPVADPPPAAPVQPVESTPVTTSPVVPPPAISPAEAAPVRLGDALWELVQGSEPLTLTPDRTTHRIGERMTLTVVIPSAGYLNILGIGPDDQPQVLYPNKYVADNRVEPGRMTFPTPNMPIAFKAQEPAGVTRLFALLSAKPLNLYTESQSGGASVSQVLEPYIGGHEKSARRALFHGGRLELQVCPAQAPCP